MDLAGFISVEDAVKSYFGNDVTISSSTRTFRSDINGTGTLSLSNGERVFIKTNTLSNSSFFDAEEEGLFAIASTNAIGTPRLYGKGCDRSRGISFLLMELVEEGRPDKDTWNRMGRDLAKMHLADTGGFVEGGKFGFLHDNFIGASPQVNTPKETWIDFFRICRLEPQLKMAEHALLPYASDISKFMDGLDDLLVEPDHPSLLHGDLWGGNHLVDKTGTAILIDPAAYVGHFEADIAMTEMFGRLPSDFYDSYREIIPLDGYSDRRDIYNLYHYLNHFNLFGGSYLSASISIIRKYV